MKEKNILKGKIKTSAEFSQYSSLILVLIILCVILSVTTDTFATGANITNVLRQISITGILAVGMSICFVVGEIDLSVGSGVGFMGGLLTIMMKNGAPFFVTLLAILAVGMVIGTFNGFFTAKFAIPSFIATLAAEYILRGALYLMTDGIAITGLPASFISFYTSRILGIPGPVWVMFLMYLLGFLMLGYTTIGRSLFAIGGNMQAAEYSGINPVKTKTIAFIFCGICTAVAAILQTSRLGSAQPSAGTGMEMDAIVAGCVGGMSMGGGYGSVIGVFIGTCVIGVLTNGMVLLGINTYLQLVVKGIIILFAVIYNMRKNH